MTTPPRTDVPVRSAAGLTGRWATVLDPPVFGARSLWLMWLDGEGQMLPVVIPVDDLPLVPAPTLLAGLLSVHDGVSEEHLGGGGHFALALCRPGRPEITEDDDEWAEALRDALDDQIVGTWSLHLAAAGSVHPLVDPPEGFATRG
jgi:hypothetical protein